MYKVRIEHAKADGIIYRFKSSVDMRDFLTSILSTFDNQVTVTIWETNDNE